MIFLEHIYSEAKWVNPILNIIGVNSLRLRSLHLLYIFPHIKSPETKIITMSQQWTSSDVTFRIGMLIWQDEHILNDWNGNNSSQLELFCCLSVELTLIEIMLVHFFIPSRWVFIVSCSQLSQMSRGITWVIELKNYCWKKF